MGSLDAGLRQLLGERPEDIRAGAAAVRAAAEAGEMQALEHAAVLAGAGVGEPQDWARSLQLLRQAAERGSESAHGQLEVLGGDRFDARAWTTPPAKQSLSEAPRIRRFEGFLDPATCGWLMRRARGRLQPAQVYDAQSGRPAAEPGGRGPAARPAVPQPRCGCGAGSGHGPRVAGQEPDHGCTRSTTQAPAGAPRAIASHSCCGNP